MSTATNLDVTGLSSLNNVTIVSGTATNLTVTSSTITNLNVTTGAVFNVATATTVNVTGRSTLGEVVATATTVTSLSASGIVNLTNNTNAVATNDGALRVAGGIGITQDVYAGGLITAGATLSATSGTTVPAVFFNNTLLSSFTSNSITTTSTQNLDSFASATYRSARYFNQITAGTSIHISEISVFHDGTKAYINEYGISTNNGQLGTFDATLGGGNVTLTFTANTSSSMSVKMTRITLTV
jgi:hypothetical protein